MTGIPFDAIQAAALTQAEYLLRGWLPAGRMVGKEFKIGNLQGDPGKSLSINVATGLWADFATRDAGRDLIDLRVAMTRTDRIAAARELADMLGISTINGHPGPIKSTNGRAAPANGINGHTKPAGDHWQPMIPPPPDAPPPDPGLFASYGTVHEYCGPDDRPLLYVRRREATRTERKQFHPLTYGVLNGRVGWHAKHPPAPKPLYGLNRLSAFPDATVILCEGEKSADAAQALFPDYACLSWCSGAKCQRCGCCAARKPYCHHLA